MNYEVKYPVSFQTIDCCIIRLIEDESSPFKGKAQLLMGKKPTQDKFRFIGGFVDPSDLSLEDAAVRELHEEAGINLECSKPKYLFSNRQDDERYQDSPHKILTAVFLFQYLFGYAKAGDDIAEVKWFDYLDLKENYKNLIVTTHYPLMEKIIEFGNFKLLTLFKL